MDRPGGDAQAGLVEDALVVVDLDGDLTKSIRVLAAVVAAEQQVSAAGQDGANNRAGSAAVAAVGRRERGCGGGGRGHHVHTTPQVQPRFRAAPRGFTRL